MANSDNHVSVGNIKAMIADGGWLQLIRKRMGLGDTLGALPVENMAITIVDDAEEYADYGAADGYVLSPIASKSLGICRTGATLSFGEYSLTAMSTSVTNVTPSVVGKTSNRVGVNGGTLTIEESGYYEIRVDMDLLSKFTAVYSSRQTNSVTTVKAISSALGVIPLCEKTVTSNNVSYAGNFEGNVTGSYCVFLEAGSTLSFSCETYITNTKNISDYRLVINSIIATLVRTNPSATAA